MEGVYEGISLDVLVLAVLEMDSFGPSRTGRTWSSWSSLHKQKAELWRGEGARTATPPAPDPRAGRWLSPLQQHHRLLSLLLPSWADTYPPPPIGLL